MSDTNSRFEELKRKVEKLKSDKDRAEGLLAKIKEDLEEEFGVTSIDDANKLLAKMEKKASREEQQFKKDLSIFEKKWNNV